MSKPDATVEVRNNMEDIESLLAWGCDQIGAQVAGALALLPDRDQLWRGPALRDRLGDSPEHQARVQLAHAIDAVRKLLQGIKGHSDGLHNDVDCCLERVCDQLGVLTASRAERAGAVAISIAARRPQVGGH